MQKTKINLLLIGSGGREHALAESLAKSPLCGNFYAAPGNPGIKLLATCLALDVNKPADVIEFCKTEKIDLVVVGPEGPLVAGLVDELGKTGIKAFGPQKAAAQLEGSKGFTKDLCKEAGIPTASYERFTDKASAYSYLMQKSIPIVIKADGLAAGKGVTVATTREEAAQAVEDCFAGSFGDAGASVVIEEFLEGEEVSFFALSDGEHILPLTSAQDHKRVGDGDVGANTGGMGAYSPAPIFSKSLENEVIARILQPTITTLKKRGTPYKGVLYAGLMLTQEGPQLIEYNCRFGDPETQVILPRLKTDLLELLLAVVDGQLDQHAVSFHNDFALTVVMAAQGYPQAVQKGSIIQNLDALNSHPHVTLFHAGTTEKNGMILANGGRVLNITAMGATIELAQQRAYEALQKIDWPQGFYRHDIGWREIKRAQRRA